MTPQLALIVMLQNAVYTCEQHQASATPVAYEKGFRQCAYLVPAATKRIDEWFSPPSPAQQDAADKALIAKAMAALVRINP